MMDAQFWKATGITFVINLVYAMVALVIGVVAVRWIDRHIYTEIDFMEEIKRGNIAAAIYGGFVVCAQDPEGPTAVRFDPPEGLEGIVVIPPEEVSTERARDSIPAEVPLADQVVQFETMPAVVASDLDDQTQVGDGEPLASVGVALGDGLSQ